MPVVEHDKAFLAGGGEMGAMMRAHDWSTSPLGPLDGWPQSLRSVVGLMLNSRFPMFAAWGEELGFVYNDAYVEILGEKHPSALGASFADVWADAWVDLKPLVDLAFAGQASWFEDWPLRTTRKGYDEQTWFTFSYSPVQEGSGAVAGMFCACTETTKTVLAERRQAFRLELEERLRDLVDPNAVMDAAVALLGRRLGANRVGYSEVQADDVTAVLHSCYTDGVAPLKGTLPLDGFGPAMIARQRLGMTQSSADVNVDPDQDPAAWAAIDTRAFVSVPLIRDGRFAASLYVNVCKPHTWTADEIALVEETAARTWSVVERARAEAALRKSEARQAFLLQLSDAVRLLGDPMDIHTAALRVLGEHLAVNRAFFNEVDEERDAYVIHRTFANGVAPLTGHFRLNDIRRTAELAGSGQIVVFDDATTDPRLSEAERASYVSMEVAAGVGVPLIKDGRWVAGLGVHHATPRHWTPEDIELIRETAERTWAAVERARAEAALQASEARYRALFDNMAEGFALFGVVRDSSGDITDLIYREANQALEHQTGFDRAKIIGQPLTVILRPADAERWIPIFARAIDPGEPVTLEEYAETVDRWYEVSAYRHHQDEIAVFYRDISERKRAAAAHRENEERQAFLLKFSDTLRPLAEPLAVQVGAMRVLGQHLAVNRAQYHEIEPDNEWIKPGGGYANGVPLHPSRSRMDDFGAIVRDAYEAGRTLVVSDTELDARLNNAERAAFAGIGVRAFVAVPLVKNGRFVSVLGLDHATTRSWSQAEIALVEEVAERTWAAVERARAEAATGEAEGRYRALATVGSSSIYRMSPDWREMRQLDGVGFIADTKAPTINWVETYIPVDERPRVRDAIQQAIRTKNPLELEHRVLRVDGTVGWRFSRAIPLLDDSGEIVEWFGATSDVTARVKADQSFTRLFEASPAPFLVLAPDAPHFTITEVNDAYLAATIRTREGVIGRGIFEAYPDNPDDATVTGVSRLRASLEHVLATRRSDEMPSLKYDVARLDGTYEERWWSPVNSPVLDDNGKVEAIIHNANDITENRRAETALRDSEARYRHIVEGADDFAIVRLNAHGVIASWNTGAQRLLGYSEAEALGRHGDMFFTPEDRAVDAPDHEMSRALDRGRAENERWHLRKDGSRFWGSGLMMRLDQAGGGYLKMFRDRTVEHEAEQASHASAARLRELNETLEGRVAERTIERNRVWSTSRGLLIIADLDGVFRAVNPAWTRTLGYTEAETIGCSYHDFIVQDDVHPTVEATAVAASGIDIDGFENRYRHKNGSIRRLAWNTSVEGGLIYAFGRDVTDERAREAAMQALEEQLRQSQKMEAMGSLTGGVAHDFNNLLTPILGSLDMLQRKGLGNEREQRLIAGALQSAERAKTLVQRLLAFARRQPLQTTSVDLTSLVRGMAELVSSTTGPQIKVVVDASEGLPLAKTDPNQLEMAILNLAVNARDAMPEGGTLRISINAETVGRQHRANLTPGQYLQMSVADTGIGMDEETLRRAIEPFFSTKGIGKGTGLGLSMVHGLASQLGGALTIRSTPGMGTNVELWLPQSAELLAETRPMAYTTTVAKGCGTALLVDDEDLVRLSTADMLIDLGYAVVEAASAEEALKLVDRGLQLDVLITDHLMPGMTGTELARMLQGSRPGTKVLVVSGYAEADGVAADLPRLTKPFRSVDLAASLAALG